MEIRHCLVCGSPYDYETPPTERLFPNDSEMRRGRKELTKRIIASWSWMIADAKHKFDETDISPGAYSLELKEAIELLDVLQKSVQ